MNTRSVPGLTWLNSAVEGDARAALHEICAAREWENALLSRRPYADVSALFAASDAAMAELTAQDLADAMAGHPPIGRPKPGDPVSTREQRGMAGASAELKASMLELGLTYQEKFGHVFLICATGLTDQQMLDAVRHRIDNSPEHEREIVRNELMQINRMRLQALADTERETEQA